MQILENNNTGHHYTAIVELDPQELQRAKNMAYLKYRQMMYLYDDPMKRQSLKEIERRTAPDFFDELAVKELEESIIKDFENQIEQEVVVGPKIIDVENDEGKVRLLISYFDKPVMEFPEFLPQKTEIPDFTLTKKELRQALNDKREENVRLIPKEKPAKKGDAVNVDITLSVNGNKGEPLKDNFDLIVGKPIKNDFLDLKSTNNLIGATIGEEYTLRKEPDNPVVLLATVNQIYERDIPKLDDEFAAEISEFDTLEEYRNFLKEELENQKRAEFINQSLEDSFLSYIDTIYDDIEDYQTLNLLNEENLNKFQMDLNTAMNSVGVQKGLFRVNNPQLIYDYNQIVFKQLIDDLFEKENLEIDEEELKNLKRIEENPIVVRQDLAGFKPMEIYGLTNRSWLNILNPKKEAETNLKVIKLMNLLKERNQV